MQNHAEKSLAYDYAAALAWWRDAGVDCDFTDEAQSWLEDPDQQRKPPPPAASPGNQVEEAAKEPSITKAMLPDDLDEFQTWWTNADSPLPSGAQPRLSPRGQADAKLMVLVPMPEIDDRETLLSGPQGKLVTNIAKAIGISSDDIYWASALPANMPLPDWDGLNADGLAHALRHHVALARPQRLLVFGSKLPALLGHGQDTPPDQFTQIEGIPSLATFAPERLLDHPRQRARLWHRLLQWTA